MNLTPTVNLDAPSETEPAPLRLVRPATGTSAPVAKPGFRFGTGWQVLLLALILTGGTFLRTYRLGTLQESYDAMLYENYVRMLIQVGPTNYPDIVEFYIDQQQKMPGAILPPTRFLYIFSGYLWHEVSGASPMASLRAVSCATGVSMLVLAAVFVWRLAGANFSLGVTALMATSPVLVHMSEHAFIDGFFAFWAMLALWALWECLRSPDHPGWQALYTVAGALLVLTKENSFFVFVGLTGLLALNWKLRFGTTTRRLLLLTIAGPLLGAVILLFLAGGVENLVHVYRLLVAKAYTLEYAIRTGDGPWHRYLVDIMVVSPLVLILVVGTIYRLRFNDKPALYLVGFMALTYLIMCNVKYGMNLRYSTIWELPMRYLAFAQLTACAWRPFGRRYAPGVLVAGVTMLCLYDLHQRRVFFVDHCLLELISDNLLRAVKILKDPGQP